MSLTNPMLRLQADLAAAARDLEDLDEPARQASEELAAAVREEVPVVSGYLRSTVAADEQGVGVGAVYAGVVHDSNPYAERATARVDVTGPFGDYVDDVMAAHLKPLYV